MDFSAYQLNKLTELLTSAPGIVGAALLVLLLIAVGVSRQACWWVVAAVLYVSTTGAPADMHLSFITPLQQFREYGRPICVALLAALMIPTFRWTNQWRPRLVGLGTLLFFIYEMLSAARTLSTGDFGKGFFGLIVFVLIFLTLAIGLGRWLQTMEHAKAALASIVGAGALVIAGTLIQYSVSRGSVIYGGRLLGTTSNANFLGTLLAVVLVPMLYFVAHTGATLRWRLFCALTAVLSMIMIVWTGSRTGAFMGITGFLVFFRRRLGRFTATALLCAVFGILGWAFFSPDSSLLDRFTNIHDTRSAVWGRMYQEFLAHPLTGASGGSTEGHSENSYLLVASRTGMLGLVPFGLALICIGGAIFRLIRVRRLLGPDRDMVDLLYASFFSLALGGMFEGYLFGTFSIPLLSIYVYLAIMTFLIDYAAVAERESVPDFEFTGQNLQPRLEAMYGAPDVYPDSLIRQYE